MKGNQSVAIAVTMAVSFLAALGWLLWQRQPAMPPLPAVLVQLAPADPGPARPAVARPARTTMPPAENFSAVSEKDTDTDNATPKPPLEILPENVDGPELPVIIGIVKKSADAGAESRAEGNEANIFNSSDKTLTVTVTEVNIPTQETNQTQFVLAGRAQKHFGTDDGLKMESGDQLTLQSPSYRDVRRQIP